MGKHDDKKHAHKDDAEHPEVPEEENQKHSSEEEHHDEAAAAIDPEVKKVLDSAPSEKVFVQRSKPFYRKFIVTNGDKIAYNFHTKKHAKVSFSIIFVPETMSKGDELDDDKELKKFVVSKNKDQEQGAAIYTAEGRGTVVLRWANSSLVLVKELVVSSKLKQADLQEVALENARKEVEERQRRSTDLIVEESRADADEASPHE